MNPLALSTIMATILYGIIGITMLVGGFWIVDKIIPTEIWGEIVEKKNTALAITVAGFVIAMGVIIGSVVR